MSNAEKWKEIKGFPGYSVSDHGVVKRNHSRSFDGKKVLQERILKGGHFSNGYKFVCLSKDGLHYNLLVHRLVADAFLENPQNLPVVNHKDGNKLNNSVTNLEWCTQGQNLKHAVMTGLVSNQCKIRRSVTISNSETSIHFDSMKDCADYFGFNKGWLQYKIKRYGCSFSYKQWTFEVSKRG